MANPLTPDINAARRAALAEASTIGDACRLLESQGLSTPYWTLQSWAHDNNLTPGKRDGPRGRPRRIVVRKGADAQAAMAEIVAILGAIKPEGISPMLAAITLGRIAGVVANYTNPIP